MGELSMSKSDTLGAPGAARAMRLFSINQLRGVLTDKKVREGGVSSTDLPSHSFSLPLLSASDKKGKRHPALASSLLVPPLLSLCSRFFS